MACWAQNDTDTNKEKKTALLDTSADTKFIQKELVAVLNVLFGPRCCCYKLHHVTAHVSSFFYSFFFSLVSLTFVFSFLILFSSSASTFTLHVQLLWLLPLLQVELRPPLRWGPLDGPKQHHSALHLSCLPETRARRVKAAQPSPAAAA